LRTKRGKPDYAANAGANAEAIIELARAKVFFASMFAVDYLEEQHDQLLVATNDFRALIARPNTSPFVKERVPYTIA